MDSDAESRVTSASMPSKPSIIFYDIASAPPLRTFAPNPWKTRLALNLKSAAYSTSWTDLPDIPETCAQIGVPPSRAHADGTPYPTLPAIQDLEAGVALGDTFEIALYLDRRFPQAPRLFLPGTTGLTAAFNAQVDTLFTRFVMLCDRMPFDPQIAAAVGAIFAARMERAGIVATVLTSEEREGKFVDFEAALGELAKAYAHTGGTTDHVWRAGGTPGELRQRGRETAEVGPWLDGDRPVYADLIVGAWLKMMEACLAVEDWNRVRGWQDGLWGKIVDGLRPWVQMK